jgi:hypothetical protein
MLPPTAGAGDVRRFAGVNDGFRFAALASVSGVGGCRRQLLKAKLRRRRPL